MKPINSTDTPPLSFDVSSGEVSKKVRASGNKIDWLHSISDTPGLTFDMKIKDALGRVRLEKKNCMTETNRYGELINFDTVMGEELEVVVENVRGQKKFDLFLIGTHMLKN